MLKQNDLKVWTKKEKQIECQFYYENVSQTHTSQHLIYSPDTHKKSKMF